MSSRPPDRRSHVTQGRGAKFEQPLTPRSRSTGHVALSRSDAALSLAERRRLRRLKHAVDENGLPPVTIARGLPFRIYISMRWFSGLLVIALTVVLFLAFTRDEFFIHEIYVGGTKYLTPPEIFERSGLASMHIFWVDPAQIVAQLEQDPSIANASVEVGWPPNLVQITITEREPALVWEQSGVGVWVDVRGRVMALRRDIPGLVKVIVQKPSKDVHLGPCPLQGMDEVLGPSSCVDADIVAGALQFKALYPDVTEIVYDPVKELGFRDGRGWVLWFGDGTDIVTKMAVYNKIVQTIQTQGIQPIEIDVGDPDAPYYKASPSGH